jgi:hypothetical protein
MFSDSRWKHNQEFAAVGLNIHTETKYMLKKCDFYILRYYIAVAV